MKLDPRIIEGKRPLTCFDAEYAKQFIGKKGFVTDELNKFCDLSKTQESTLKNVWPNETYCFIASVTGYKYFLPAEWVQEQKVERPYTLQEFIDNVGGVGDVVTYRFHDKSGTSQCQWTSLIVEIETYQNGESETFPIKIYIGESEFLLKELFEQCEYRKNGQWQPFGVKE